MGLADLIDPTRRRRSLRPGADFHTARDSQLADARGRLVGAFCQGMLGLETFFHLMDWFFVYHSKLVTVSRGADFGSTRESQNLSLSLASMRSKSSMFEDVKVVKVKAHRDPSCFSNPLEKRTAIHNNHADTCAKPL